MRSASFSSSSAVSQEANLKLGRLNHVAIAVPDLNEAAALYRNLGASVSAPQDLPEHGVTTIFVNLENTKLELLHPFGDNSPIQNFLAKKPGGGVHHLCYEVDDIYKAIAEVKAKGFQLLDKEPKIGAHGKPVVFIHPKSVNGVLTELEQA